METSNYWNHKGTFQNTYNYLWKLLVPTEGVAKTDEGNILRIVSKAYYRYFNDGDNFSETLEDYNFDSYFTGKHELDKIFLRSIYSSCYNPDKSVDETLKYLMLKMSTKEKIWNPNTNRLVLINTPTGKKALSLLGCKLEVSYSLDI